MEQCYTGMLSVIRIPRTVHSTRLRSALCILCNCTVVIDYTHCACEERISGLTLDRRRRREDGGVSSQYRIISTYLSEE